MHFRYLIKHQNFIGKIMFKQAGVSHLKCPSLLYTVNLSHEILVNFGSKSRYLSFDEFRRLMLLQNLIDYFELRLYPFFLETRIYVADFWSRSLSKSSLRLLKVWTLVSHILFVWILLCEVHWQRSVYYLISFSPLSFRTWRVF